MGSGHAETAKRTHHAPTRFRGVATSRSLMQDRFTGYQETRAQWNMCASVCVSRAQIDDDDQHRTLRGLRPSKLATGVSVQERRALDLEHEVCDDDER